MNKVMKTTELNCKSLMIGDLVSYNGTPIKVENIHGDCINYSPDIPYVQEEFFIDIADVKPIPLTSEILEKNGFDKFLGLGVFFCKHIETQELSIMIDVLFCKDSHIVVDIEKQSFIEGTRNSLHSCDIQSLHELQHALRLCGLNELADNLKVEE